LMTDAAGEVRITVELWQMPQCPPRPDTTEMGVERWVRARLREVRIQEPNREQIEDIEDED
jgi:hypothetical protein